jgi:dihydrolipoamide dehydrogenase
MNRRTVDVAIIGAGTGGLNARREVEKAGRSWVLIENGPYGTTCARVGCMPSKLLIAAAEARHEVAHADRFGVRVHGHEVDGRAVMDRVRRERDRFVGFVVDATEALPEDRRLRGTARFVGPTTLRVDAHTEVEAGSVVIATGSSPWVPPPFEALRATHPDRVLVNDDVFDWEDLPESVAVVGTGIIGLELGQALHRLGVETAFFNPFEQLGPFTDPAVHGKAREVLGAELHLHLGIAWLGAEAIEGGVRLRWRDPDGGEGEGLFEKVLVAAGRRPNLDALDLAAAGVPVDGKGMPPWDRKTCQVGAAPLFMAGDVNAHLPLLHEAADEGRIAGANAVRFPEVAAHVRREPLAVAFTAPQMAMVGAAYGDLAPESVAVGEVSYDDQGRARVMGINAGLVRIYALRESCRLVGAEMFGPRVEHTAHLLAWAVQQDLNVYDALKMPFYHPVIEEGIRTALKDLARNLRALSGCRPEDLAESPGA